MNHSHCAAGGSDRVSPHMSSKHTHFHSHCHLHASLCHKDIHGAATLSISVSLAVFLPPADLLSAMLTALLGLQQNDYVSTVGIGGESL